jgi:hypothetical protein
VRGREGESRWEQEFEGEGGAVKFEAGGLSEEEWPGDKQCRQVSGGEQAEGAFLDEPPLPVGQSLDKGRKRRPFLFPHHPHNPGVNARKKRDFS